jgi:two-component system, cell cycle response regulator DivK
MNPSQNLHQSRNNSFRSATYSHSEKRPVVLIAQGDAKSLKELLDLYELVAIQVRSSEEVVDAAIIYRPDLIIIDSSLSGLGSFEAIRLIRSITSLSAIPIIFLSDYPHRTERYRAFETGCAEYLAKPLDLDRLDCSLERFLFQNS